MPVRLVSSRQPGAGGSLLQQVTIATEGQPLIPLTFPYEPGSNRLQVWVNGLLQYADLDYTETGPTEITFAVPLAAGDKVLIRSL